MLKNEAQGKKVSQTIVRISIISIALAIVVNLITVAVVKGFQNQVKDKIAGFSAHLSIFSASEPNIYEASPILKNQAFFSDLKKNQEIKSVSLVAYKPVLFQSDKNQRVVTFSSGTDSIVSDQNIQGAILKGVDSQYDWSFFKEHLIEGALPDFSKNIVSHEILISKRIAKDLNYNLGDTIRAFFVRTIPVLKKMVVKGIFETGLEEHDQKLAIGDLRLVQELNDWGIQASISIDDTLYKVTGYEDQLIIRVNARGGQGQFRYDWGNGPEIYGAKTFYPEKDTLIRVIVSDYSTNLLSDQSLSIADTCYLKISISGNKKSINQFELVDGVLDKKYENEDGTQYVIKSIEKSILVEQKNGKGSANQYVAGIEIKVKDWNQLDEIRLQVKKTVAISPTLDGQFLRVESIKEAENDIFVWLGFLDINVLIILTLMILIGIINMGSTLLVLILVKTNFIGILKTLGASNWSIRKIFLYQAMFLILRGMLIGNVVGIGLIALQYYFNIIPLNPEIYYLNTVPIELNFINWFLLNLGTLIICISALIIPSVVITKVNPVKAVRFN